MAFVQLSRSFNLPSTLIIRCHVSTRATKEASCFWGCGQFLTLIIKRILDIKRIFPCNFGNKRMRLLTRVYGTSQSSTSKTRTFSCPWIQPQSSTWPSIPIVAYSNIIAYRLAWHRHRLFSSATWKRSSRACMDGVSAYLNDILVAGCTLDEHLNRLAEVLQRLENSGMRLNKQKCLFLRSSIGTM